MPYRTILAIVVVLVTALISSDLPWPWRRRSGISGPVVLVTGVGLAALLAIGE